MSSLALHKIIIPSKSATANRLASSIDSSLFNRRYFDASSLCIITANKMKNYCNRRAVSVTINYFHQVDAKCTFPDTINMNQSVFLCTAFSDTNVCKIPYSMRRLRCSAAVIVARDEFP